MCAWPSKSFSSSVESHSPHDKIGTKSSVWSCGRLLQFHMCSSVECQSAYGQATCWGKKRAPRFSQLRDSGYIFLAHRTGWRRQARWQRPLPCPSLSKPRLTGGLPSSSGFPASLSIISIHRLQVGKDTGTHMEAVCEICLRVENLSLYFRSERQI